MTRTRAELVEAIRAIAAEIRETDGPVSIVPDGLERFADLHELGPIDHAAIEALGKEFVQ